MTSRQLALTLDAHDPARLAQFWAGVLGREVVEDAGGVLLPGDDTQLGLRRDRAGQQLSRRDPVVHGDQQADVDRLVSLGATRLDSGAVELADPDGNEFCVRAN
ncbi:VOC family protein [Micromonospora sp. WMMA1363]|uniref:VOC family protein n=1 Tax=Micromonospora sp. WMMA1363 TaxID=3053985 RepID=UPI00259CA664|nr:VOC family protein [Micromonospora sp. WMMA1363]MDM4718852.1 VOC family protein [Micromonospora sp. WMMA1363]